MDLTQWTDRKSSLEAVSQMKWTLRCDGIGVGVARRNRVMSSPISLPSTSKDSASSAPALFPPWPPPSLLLPPFALSPSRLSSSAATVRATVSMALARQRERERKI